MNAGGARLTLKFLKNKDILRAYPVLGRANSAYKIERLIGEVYVLLKEKEDTEMRDASEFSTLLNATRAMTMRKSDLQYMGNEKKLMKQQIACRKHGQKCR